MNGDARPYRGQPRCDHLLPTGPAVQMAEGMLMAQFNLGFKCQWVSSKSLRLRPMWLGFDSGLDAICELRPRWETRLKSFGTFEKRAPGRDNLHGRPMSSYGASSLFCQAIQANLRASYRLPIPNPTPAKIRLHRRRSQGHIVSLCMKRPSSLKLTTLHVLKQFTVVKLLSSFH